LVAECGANGLEHAVHFVVNVAGPKAKYAKSSAAEFFVTRVVMSRLRRASVLNAINLNDQLLGPANEIKNVRRLGRLTPEMPPLGFERAKLEPERDFRRAHRLAKFAGALNGFVHLEGNEARIDPASQGVIT
jgi:hypothetical protein